MFRFILKIVGLFWLFLAAFSSALSAAPAAWRVEGDKGAMVVFGTMHRLPEGVQWFSEDLRRELEKSGLLVLEVEKTQASDDYLGYLMRQPGIAISGKTLNSKLDEAAYRTFLERIAPFGYTEEQVKNYRPWYAVTLLNKLGGDQIGLEFELGSEETIAALAREKGLEIFGLESPAQQTLFFSELPGKVEVAWLEKILSRGQESGGRSKRLFKDWVEGDLQAIEEQIISSYREIPKIYEVFIKERNEAWAGQLLRLLDHENRIFVAVGTAHMVGPDSVLKLLEEEGYSVTRIQ